ncbi:hypothetical protein [Motilimonas sp. KMU-193]|uniref:hypothetical protein n=1 Tax=Motilimonas sp. KMU-193 TaxID=3388668 RepID=UPI00396B3429
MNTSYCFSNQIRAFLFYSLSILFWGGLALVALNWISPPWMSRITMFVEDNVRGWDEAACEADQQGCLGHKQRELLGLEKTMNSSLRKLVSEAEKMQLFVLQHQKLASRNTELIREGESLLSQLTPEQTEIDLWLAGRHFSKADSFRHQVNLLKQEKVGIEQQLAKAEQLQTQMITNREKLLLKKGELSLQIKMIPSQLALLKSSEVLVGFSENIGQIDGLITSSYEQVDDLSNMIQTTQDFMKSE